jgi:DNA-binding MarR family transcriptional regulator
MTAKKLRFYSRLQIAAHKLKKDSDRLLLDVAGVTTAQISALAIIASEKTVTQTVLARELGLNDSAITAMVRRLIDQKMVQRMRDDSDGRAWLLELTDTGAEAVDRAASIMNQTHVKVDELLGEKTIATVVAALELVINDSD